VPPPSRSTRAGRHGWPFRGELVDHLEGEEIAEAERHFDTGIAATPAATVPSVTGFEPHPKHATATSVS